MKALHFTVAYRRKGTEQAAAQAHIRYIMRVPEHDAGAHAAYVTRTTQTVREDLVATGYGNLPDWAQDNPVEFFAASDRYERLNGRTATQLTAALPRELTHAQQQAAVEGFLRSQLGNRHAFVWGMHETVAGDGGRYPHVHVAFSERTDMGTATTAREYFSQAHNPKDRAFNDRNWPQHARQAWSDHLNVALEGAGSPARVSARSFTDQGLDETAAPYIKRQELQRDKGRLQERGQRDDTPEMQAKRVQEWEARKVELGLTRGMEAGEIAQRIREASRVRKPAGEMPEAVKQVQQLRQAEEQYVQHPERVRTSEHLASVARVLRDEEHEHGFRRKRRHGRDEDDEQARSRSYGYAR